MESKEDLQYVINRVNHIICEYGDGETEFNTRDVNRLLNEVECVESFRTRAIAELDSMRNIESPVEERVFINSAIERLRNLK